MSYAYNNIASSKNSNDFLSKTTLELLQLLDHPLFVAQIEGRTVLSSTVPSSVQQLAGMVPAVRMEDLGTRTFRDAHNLRYSYLTGAMANGIASVELVVAMGKAGFMGFFGSGGLPLSRVEEAIQEIQKELSHEPYGFNLLHNPFEPKVEMATVELYLKYGVRRIEAAAFMEITPAIAMYRAKGMRELPDGRIVAPNRIFAKVSRPELAARFMAPAPESLLKELVSLGKITQEEARLAAILPVAQDITAEADSGGHTDQRPLSVLIPILIGERERAYERYGYQKRKIVIHIGAAGGIGDPLSAHAAFCLGADYLVTGSINQIAIQGGTSSLAKQMLSEIDMADVAVAPAPDMFEMGARVQILKRGTLYAQRAQKLLELYKNYPSFESIPANEKEKVEKQIFQRTFTEVWEETEKYWQTREPARLEKVRNDGKEKMSLCFRWYLGLSSRWAVIGEPSRKYDFQIWCGPSLAAFNRWVKGTWLEPLEKRDAAIQAKAILTGVCALVRRDVLAKTGMEELPSVFETSRPKAQL